MLFRRRNFCAKIRLLLFLLLSVVFSSSAMASFYVDYSEAPDIGQALAHEVAIFSSTADVDLERLKQAGVETFAYMSVGELAPDAPHRGEAIKAGIALLGRNEIWHSDLVDIADPQWHQLLIQRLAADAAARGFAGFFLDTLDSVEALIADHPHRAAEFRHGLVLLVKELRAAFPDHKIIVNRGFLVLDEIAPLTNGLLVESYLHTFDLETKRYRPVAAEDRKWLRGWIEKAADRGLDIYILDYADPADTETALRVAREVEAMGHRVFVSTPELDGKMLAPLREEPRWFYVCYGNGGEDLASAEVWPSDTFTATAVQMPMEWLGYELSYRHLRREGIPPALDDSYRGILLDHNLEVPIEREPEFVDWLLQEVQSGKKLLIFGEFPIRTDRERNRLLKGLGFQGTGQRSGRVKEPRIVEIDETVMNFETRVRPKQFDFADLRKPENGEVFLALAAGTPDGETLFHPAGASSWGGWALAPYCTFTRADGLPLWYLDPFAFLERSLGPAPFPAPDPNTRSGLRVFYSHIDGDGFANLSEVELGRRSAEIIRDHVLKRYRLPVTVSVIEAEIRQLLAGADPAPVPEMEAIAREIFRLPNVQAASHSYSHPLVWIPGDWTESNYGNANLPLTVSYPKIDYEREVAGSVQYIEENLLPPEKRVELFLWSGNTRPPAEALAWTRRIGIENMNGGMTAATRRLPTLHVVAPRSMPWGGELQIFAASQNENVFTNDWQGPFFGGYIQILDTFARTESPRRLKPVNLYYHFYSGNRHDSLNAIVQLYDWVLEQDLHPVTATEYARSVRDSRHARFFRGGEAEWIIVSDGHVRTFRLPAGGPLPRVGPDQGVIGYAQEENFVYLHTDGRQRVRISLEKELPAQLRLERSNADVRLNRMEQNAFSFDVRAYGEGRVILAGGAPGSKVDVAINAARQTMDFDPSGRLLLRLPETASVEVVPHPEGGDR